MQRGSKPTLLQTVLASEKFKAWSPRIGSPQVTTREALEKHYSPAELAEAWGLSPDTIRELFENESGVLVIGHNGSRSKRRYRTFRIPESVAIRVHRKLSAG